MNMGQTPEQVARGKLAALGRETTVRPGVLSTALELAFAETGQSPAKAIENLRVEAARLAIEEERHSLDEVARMTGFGDRERMRRAFLRTVGQPPQVLRRNVYLASQSAGHGSKPCFCPR